MRRLLGALLALALVTSGAHAKGLVIIHEGTGNAAPGSRIQEGLVLDALRELGGSYDAVRSSQFAPGVTIQNLRRGRYFNGTDSITYNPVVHVGYYNGRSTSFDSLTITAYYPSVAHLFIGNMGHDGGAWDVPTAACSVGVKGTGGAVNDSAYVTYVVGNPGIRWVQENVGAACSLYVEVGGGKMRRGIRPIWGVRTSTRAKAVTTNSPTDWPTYDDSFDGTYPTTPDSTCFWQVLNRGSDGTAIQRGTQAAAVPMTFVMPTYKYGYSAGEMTPYVAALLLADSLSGGGLFPEASRKVALGSIHIDDGWKRGNSRNGGTVYGGIDIADTAYFKASIDSLRALGEKYVVGVEIDSVRIKAGYDDRWWSATNAPTAHFTPHCHAGTTNSTGQVQDLQVSAGPYWRMQDLWGTNNRVRIAWGGGTGLGRDSSLAALHKRAFFLMDSIFTPSRVDHVSMPPGDDWSPTYNSTTGVGAWPMPMTLDSLLFAWDFAGGRGIRNNSASNTSLVSQRIGSYGYTTGTMDYTVTLTATGANDHRGYRGRFVSCPSYPTSASSLSYSRLSAGKGVRAYNSMLNGRIFMTPDPSSNTATQFAKAQIIAIHVSDLGGDKYGRATRPGFYCIKYPVMASRAANAVGRWTAIRWVYPEELCP